MIDFIQKPQILKSNHSEKNRKFYYFYGLLSLKYKIQGFSKLRGNTEFLLQ